MAETSCLPETHQPIRSISLPSRLHPPSVKLDAALNRLSPWRTNVSSISVTVPVNAESLHVGLLNLSELYNCVHELLQSPHIRNALNHHQSGKLLRDASEISVVLIDACEMTRSVLLGIKERVENLQTAVRRKGTSADLILGKSIYAYTDFRKKSKREIGKIIEKLKKLERKSSEFRVLMSESYDFSKLVDVLRETLTVSISIFRSLLLFLSVSRIKTRIGGLLSGSKLIPFLSISSPSFEKKQSLNLINEVQRLDLVLCSFQDRRSIVDLDTKAEVVTIQKTLETVDERIRVLETGLDSVFKCLVLNRVNFLNIISNQC